jgi:ABC-type molybdate transport system substrate-binding protein
MPTLAAGSILLHAAGSLRFALTEVIAAYEPMAGVRVQASFGASGARRHRSDFVGI